MTDSAPRVDARIVAALERLDDPKRPIAETYRRLGRVTDQLGLPRPSYEQVRRLVHGLRRGEPASGVGSILLDVALRTRPPQALLDVLVDDAAPAHRRGSS